MGVKLPLLKKMAVSCVTCAILAGPAPVCAYEAFRADLLCVNGGSPEFRCGDVMAGRSHARLDVMLDKAGGFRVLVDAKEKVLRVLSEKLKAYVEIPVAGDVESWQDLLASAASAVMPQSMGLISLYEKESEALGKVRLNGYAADRSRHVFEASFMGTSRTFTIEVWEHEKFQPFPLKAELEGRTGVSRGIVRLSGVKKGPVPEQDFSLPLDCTRYSSVIDLLLYALTAL